LLDSLATEEREHENQFGARQAEAAGQCETIEVAGAFLRSSAGLAGLMDRSVSTLAPVFAAAFATQKLNAFWSG
jgi:hypothetical protein